MNGMVQFVDTKSYACISSTNALIARRKVMSKRSGNAIAAAGLSASEMGEEPEENGEKLADSRKTGHRSQATGSSVASVASDHGYQDFLPASSLEAAAALSYALCL